MKIQPRYGMAALKIAGAIYVSVWVIIILIGLAVNGAFADESFNKLVAILILYFSISMIGVYALYISTFIGTLKKVDVGHIGLLVVLGERRSEEFVPEGIVWLPPFTTVEQFDAREREFKFSADKILSKDSIPIRLKSQIRVRTTDPYKFSDVVSPDETIQEESIAAIRTHIANLTALEIACAADLHKDLLEALSSRAESMGLKIASLSITELQLPDELEKYAQVISAIRDRHPEISFREALDAVQTNQTEVKRHIIESSTISDAANAIFAKVVRGN